MDPILPHAAGKQCVARISGLFYGSQARTPTPTHNSGQTTPRVRVQIPTLRILAVLINKRSIRTRKPTRHPTEVPRPKTIQPRLYILLLRIAMGTRLQPQRAPNPRQLPSHLGYHHPGGQVHLKEHPAHLKEDANNVPLKTAT